MLYPWKCAVDSAYGSPGSPPVEDVRQTAWFFRDLFSESDRLLESELEDNIRHMNTLSAYTMEWYLRISDSETDSEVDSFEPAFRELCTGDTPSQCCREMLQSREITMKYEAVG